VVNAHVPLAFNSQIAGTYASGNAREKSCLHAQPRSMKPRRSTRQQKLDGRSARRTLRLSAGGVRIPFPGGLRDFRKEWVRPDIVAGLTVAAVVIPKALAYATIAGLPVQVGLYTALAPMLIYALLGTSRVLSVNTTTTIDATNASSTERRALVGATRRETAHSSMIGAQNVAADVGKH
jgi:Sulfate permease family